MRRTGDEVAAASAAGGEESPETEKDAVALGIRR